jgi:hypothetical protein
VPPAPYELVIAVDDLVPINDGRTLFDRVPRVPILDTKDSTSTELDSHRPTAPRVSVDYISLRIIVPFGTGRAYSAFGLASLHPPEGDIRCIIKIVIPALPSKDCSPLSLATWIALTLSSSHAYHSHDSQQYVSACRRVLVSSVSSVLARRSRVSGLVDPMTVTISCL